jgi:hypothetical protein
MKLTKKQKQEIAFYIGYACIRKRGVAPFTGDLYKHWRKGVDAHTWLSDLINTEVKK